MKNPRILVWPLPIICLLASPLSAAVLTVTDLGFTGAFTAGTPESLTGVASVATVTTSEGTFGSLTGATASNATGQRYYKITDPGADADTLTGLVASDGLLNLSTPGGTNIQLGSGFTANTRFFILDAASAATAIGDPATVSLIDSANNVVGTFSLSLATTDFGTKTAVITGASREGGVDLDLDLGGVTFSLADFAGSGTVGDVTGIRLTGAAFLDPAVVGFYNVPEPSVISLIGLGLGGSLIRRRRC